MDTQNALKTGDTDNGAAAKTPKYPVKDPASTTKVDVIPASPEPDDTHVINIEVDDTDNTDEDDGIVKLSQTYKFDGEVISELDLSGLEDLGQIEAQKIEKLYKKFAKGNISVQPELTDEYAIVTAHHLTGLPLEFFKHIRHKDILKIRNRVINFTFGD